MKNRFKISKIVAAFILALTFLGCNDDDVVLPQLVAEFTHTINQDTGTVVFINTSTNADSYSWSFGDADNTTSTEVNPIFTYPSGTYTIILEATNVAGASDTFEDTITIAIPEVIGLPITFDNAQVSYDATVFNGATFQVVENPDLSGTNAVASNVGEIVNSGAAFEGFFFNLGLPIDLNTDKSIKMNFWSNTPTSVLLKLEGGTGADVEVAANHGGTGWEEIFFTFDSASSYSITTFFVDGAGTAAGTFYMDDVVQINSSDIPCTETDLKMPISFDCDGIDYASKIVGNVSFTVVDNPEVSGINNTETKVGQLTNGGDNFENAFFNLDVPVDFSTDKGIKVKLYSTQALPVLLKFEDGTEADVENLQNHTGSGWEELTFVLNSAGSYNDMILFVAFNQTDAGTFYVDDFEQVSATSGPPCTPETAESIAATDLNITFQTNTPTFTEDNTTFSWIDNPDSDNAVNTSCKVGQATRVNNSAFDNLQIDLADKLDFNASEGLKMKVWSPVANITVLMKLEEIGNSGNSVEIPVITTVTNGWEELTFDFAATPTPQFDKIVIFFNFNQADASTYYFDDLMVYGTGSGGSTCTPESSESIMASNLDITFQTDTPALIGDNTAGAYIDNPDFSGSVNSSCRVAEVTRFGASAFDNVQIDLADKLDFNTSEGIRMKVWSPVANTPVLLKLEEIGNPSNSVEILQTTTAASAWEELTFDFDATATPQFDKLVIFFNFNVVDASTYYFDDLRVYGTPGGGGGPGNCPAPPAGDFIADGDFEANADCWLLFDSNTSNGGTTSISTSVSNGGGTNSGQIQTAPGGNPGIKQERFGVGTIQPNTSYVVTFDIKADSATPLADGAVFQAFTFSEPAEGSPAGATQHILIAGDASVTTSWSSRSYTFTTANNIDGGLSLLFELVCGGAATCGGIINIDNVSITAQ